MLQRVANQKQAKTGAEVVNLFNTSTSESVDMKIADKAFIFDVLTNISKNPYNYVVRECYSNAYDATLKAQSTEPIELSIFDNAHVDTNSMAARLNESPQIHTDKNYRFAVSDHGIGMSPGDVKKYFLQYGGSKKRSTGDIDAIGSKGLGAKAPLAISNIFFVETTKDGITTKATVYKTAKGFNSADVTSIKTDKPSGTTICIPIDESDIVRIKTAVSHIIPLHINVKFSYIDEYHDEPIVEYRTFNQGDKLNWSLDTPVLKENFHRRCMPLNSLFLGTKTIDGATISMWYSVDDFINKRFTDPTFNIGGIEYKIYQYNQNVYVDMPAGFLNFTPSRDDIKRDEQYDTVVNFLKKWFDDIKDTYFDDNKTAILKNIDKFDCLFSFCARKSTYACLMPNKDNSIHTQLILDETDIDDISDVYTKELTRSLIWCIKNNVHVCQSERISTINDVDFKYDITIKPYNTVYICSKSENLPHVIKYVRQKPRCLFVVTENDDQTSNAEQLFSNAQLDTTADINNNDFAIICGKKVVKNGISKSLTNQKVTLYKIGDDTHVIDKYTTFKKAIAMQNVCILFNDNAADYDNHMSINTKLAYAKIKCAIECNKDIDYVCIIPKCAANDVEFIQWHRTSDIPVVISLECRKSIYAENVLSGYLSIDDLKKATNIRSIEELMAVVALNLYSTRGRYISYLIDTITDIGTYTKLPPEIEKFANIKLPKWLNYAISDELHKCINHKLQHPNTLDAFITANKTIMRGGLSDIEKPIVAKLIVDLTKIYMKSKKE